VVEVLEEKDPIVEVSAKKGLTVEAIEEKDPAVEALEEKGSARREVVGTVRKRENVACSSR
jgi:hypothetical protein